MKGCRGQGVIRADAASAGPTAPVSSGRFHRRSNLVAIHRRERSAAAIAS